MKKEYALLLIFLSAILTVLLWKGFLNILVWIYLIPLLVAILKSSTKKMIFYMIIYSIVMALFSFGWVTHYSYYIWVIGFLFFMLFHIALGLLIKLFVKKAGYLEIFILPLMWLLLYYAFNLMPLDNFWLNLSAFNSEAAPLIWYTGSSGILFLIVLFNSSTTFFILKKKMSYLAVMIAIVMVMSACFIYSNYKEPEGEKFKVALIQGNFPQSWDYRVKNAKTEVYQTYKRLTFEALKYNPDLIIWPEYSIPTDIFEDKNFSEEFLNFSKGLNSNLIVGTLLQIDDRFHYDTALIFSKNSNEVLRYNSVMPLPYKNEDSKGYDILETMEAPFSKFGIVMCYEETQLEISREHTRNDAEFIIALSNNGRLKESNGIFLTSLYSRVSAAENAKYVVRTTNTGITQVINPYGKVVVKIKPFTRDILITEIYLNNKKTFYTKNGNILLNIFTAVLIILLIKNNLKREGL